MARHNVRDASGQFAPAPAGEPPRAKHVTSAYQRAQISPTGAYRPHQLGGVLTRQAASAVSPSAPYAGPL